MARYIAFRPSDVEFRPPHVRGDREFDGNGPVWQVSVQINVRGPLLVCNLRAFFQETKPDYTTFSGSREFVLLNTDEQFPGEKITSINTQVFDFKNGVDEDHYDEVIAGGGPVDHYRIRGDSDGGIFGGNDLPQVNVMFRTLSLTLEKI